MRNLSSSPLLVRVYDRSVMDRLRLYSPGEAFVCDLAWTTAEQKEAGPRSNWKSMERQQCRIIDRQSKRGNDDGGTAVTQKTIADLTSSR